MGPRSRNEFASAELNDEGDAAQEREMFLLDPGVTYLDHGAFGACPRPVFEKYQAWQRELERSPVALLGRRIEDELATVRAQLGAYVGADVDELALILNATVAINTVLRSIPLTSGDEILTTDHEYGAVQNLLDFIARRTGARIVRAPETSADAIWASASARTKVLVVSHITSPTAVLMPVRALCERARAAGVVSVIDGAHGPGQLMLDLRSLGADFYVGNCHKWLCGPKAAAFLHARASVQSMIEPLVVGWGYGDSPFEPGQDWRSARDPAAYLAIPAAIDFVRQHGRNAECRTILDKGRRLLRASGFEPFADEGRIQMGYFRVPPCDPIVVCARLRAEFGIEVPIRVWRGDPMLRVSVAPYNTIADLRRLTTALSMIFPQARLNDEETT
ncbi:aminotransferase class V-fold PLP-dependent enzyme [Nocardia sp. NPDC050630]|uniref:aminotransferase class V-fold PLP-dependent enzyme n=1 Tax=Nocardia sp. NPDC050630 TaxID=3364321 RepID=UPI0037B8E3F1